MSHKEIKNGRPGLVRPLREDAYRKCLECGDTLMVKLDAQLHACDKWATQRKDHLGKMTENAPGFVGR